MKLAKVALLGAGVVLLTVYLYNKFAAPTGKSIADLGKA